MPGESRAVINCWDQEGRKRGAIEVETRNGRVHIRCPPSLTLTRVSAWQLTQAILQAQATLLNEQRRGRT